MSERKRIEDHVRDQIQRARENEGLTMSQLHMRFPGIGKTSIFRIIENCDSSKVMRAAPSRKVVQPTEFKDRPKLSKGDLGEAARQMICARLMLHSICVFRPMTEDTPTDLLVLTKSGKVLKCQCKYIFPEKRGSHNMCLYSIRKNGPNRKAVRHVYTSEEVDFFLGYCLDNDSVYVIPYSETRGKQNLIFWVSRSPFGNNQTERFNTETWKETYDLLL
jgi:hypothetical protein